MVSELKTMLADSFQYREVLANLVAYDFKIKYKRTSLGYLWSLLNPLIQLAVLTVVFSRFVGRGMKDYSLYLFSGMLAWTFFQQALINAAYSFIEFESFIKKVYLPKLIFPISRLGLRGMDYLLMFVALLLIALVGHFPLHPTLLLLPLATLLLFAMTAGFALMFSVACVFFRDVQYLLNVGLQLLYYVTPILYPEDTWPPQFAPLFRLNPMYWQVKIFHQLVYFGTVPSALDWTIAAGISVTSLLAGLVVLKSFEEELMFRL